MHAISFLLKRAHLRTTDVGQKILYKVPGMTPARFDIVCYLRQLHLKWGLHGGSTSQKLLTFALGLHASVISRMLKRLEQLKWITRVRDIEDRRCKIIQLTELGMRKAWEAMRINFRGRALASQFETLARNLEPTRHPLQALDHLFDTLDVIAADFGDSAHFHYTYGSAQRPPFHRCTPRMPSEMMVCVTRGTPRGRDAGHPAPTPYQKWVAPLLEPIEKVRRMRPWLRIQRIREQQLRMRGLDAGDPND